MHYPVEGPVADAEWRLTQPQTHYGYVRLGPDRRTFAVAMFHELHCVNTFRKALLMPAAREENLHHVQHCLNYLRQLFLCAADATLEPGDFAKREYYRGAPGMEGVIGEWGATRECRDWSVIIDAAEENYVDWREFLAANRSHVDH
ncbi:hypothetical protein OF83DRAFT_1115844 [Amylostereum chailletii]|nr:hypothetical protein OF83DRAFT_1115844 [Amylostereum chailletii]